MGKAQGWTDQCTTLLVYSIFAIIVGSYGAYEHEFERGSMHSLYAGVRPPAARDSSARRARRLLLRGPRAALTPRRSLL